MIISSQRWLLLLAGLVAGAMHPGEVNAQQACPAGYSPVSVLDNPDVQCVQGRPCSGVYGPQGLVTGVGACPSNTGCALLPHNPSIMGCVNAGLPDVAYVNPDGSLSRNGEIVSPPILPEDGNNAGDNGGNNGGENGGNGGDNGNGDNNNGGNNGGNNGNGDGNNGGNNGNGDDNNGGNNGNGDGNNGGNGDGNNGGNNGNGDANGGNDGNGGNNGGNNGDGGGNNGNGGGDGGNNGGNGGSSDNSGSTPGSVRPGGSRSNAGSNTQAPSEDGSASTSGSVDSSNSTSLKGSQSSDEVNTPSTTDPANTRQSAWEDQGISGDDSRSKNGGSSGGGLGLGSIIAIVVGCLAVVAIVAGVRLLKKGKDNPQPTPAAVQENYDAGCITPKENVLLL